MKIKKEDLLAFVTEYLASTMLALIIYSAIVFTKGLESFIIAFGVFFIVHAFSKFRRVDLYPSITIGLLLSKKFTLQDVLNSLAKLFAQFLGFLTVYPFVTWLRDQYINLQIDSAGVGITNSTEIKANILEELSLVNSYNNNFLSFAFILELVLVLVFTLGILFVLYSKSTKKSYAVVLASGIFVTTFLISQSTGSSLHPFKSLVPALFEKGESIRQLRVFVIAPIVASMIAGSLVWFMNWLAIPGVLNLGNTIQSSSKGKTKKQDSRKKVKKTKRSKK